MKWIVRGLALVGGVVIAWTAIAIVITEARRAGQL